MKALARNLCLIFFVTSFGSLLYFEYHFSDVGSRTQNSGTGQVFMHNVHGDITYITRKQHDILIGLQLTSLAFGVSAVLFDKASKKSK